MGHNCVHRNRRNSLGLGLDGTASIAGTPAVNAASIYGRLAQLSTQAFILDIHAALRKSTMVHGTLPSHGEDARVARVVWDALLRSAVNSEVMPARQRLGPGGRGAHASSQ